MRRILTALVGLPIIFLTIKYFPPVVFLVLVLAAVVVGSYEFYAIAEKGGFRPHKLLGAALAAAVAWTFFEPRLGTVEILCAATILVPLASMVRGRSVAATRLDEELGAIAVTWMAVPLFGLLMGYCVALLGDGGERGRDLIVLLFLVVWLADAAAYMVGSLWGRHKLAPSISPGKTVEGALGALVVAVLAALVAKAWFFTGIGIADAVALGLLLGVFGMLGDLAESLLKRTGAVKDSGSLLPGHGGLLDRADSLLFAAPVLFYYHQYLIE